jgi:hypothetical protein
VSIASDKARLAGLIAHRDPADPDIKAARSNLRAAVAEDYITRLVAQAPPLTPEQRVRLAVLLLAADGSGGDRAAS